MKMVKFNKNPSVDQRGFASIVIALTLVIILALMTVGFAQLSRREQRNALNKQLSIQAYYAAETGIEDARADILADKILSTNTNCTPNIKPPVSSSKLIDKDVDTQLGVSYSCVSIDLAPTSLVYSNVGDSSYRTVSFTNDSGQPIQSLTISWSPSDNLPRTPPASNAQFTNQPAWTAAKYPSVVETSLTPLPLGGLNNDSLTANNFTAYGYPVSGGGVSSVAYGSSSSPQEGSIVNSNCVSNLCSTTITGLGVLGNVPLLLHLTNHYDVSDLTVTGKDIVGNPVKFNGAQAVVDVTGRSRDVLKRLQAHISLGKSNLLPNYAIESQNVCKRITTYPNPTGTSTDYFYQPSIGVGSQATLPGDPCYLN